MHAHTRQTLIIQILEKQKFIKTIELLNLMEKRGIPAITTRRDLKKLSESGTIKLIHGAIMLLSKKPELDLVVNENKEKFDTKLELASKSSALIEEDSTIFVSCGVVNQLLMKEINQSIKTLVTDSPEIFNLSLSNKHIKHRFLLGGWYNDHKRSFYGVEQQINIFNFNTIFLESENLEQDFNHNDSHIVKLLQYFNKDANHVLIINNNNHNKNALLHNQIGDSHWNNFQYLVVPESLKMMVGTNHHSTTII